jgi:N-hydroxyarylamine O-acetyltransferase
VRASRLADAEVAEAHRVLSTPPDGRFTRVLAAMRRDDTGAEVLRGIQHQRTGDGALTRDPASYDDWRAALESLGVSLAGAGRPRGAGRGWRGVTGRAAASRCIAP